MKLSITASLIFIFFFYGKTSAQPKIINGVSLPADFPELVVTTNINPSPGKLFLSNTSGNGFYVMIFENDGTPYYYRKVNNYSTDFKLQPNGNITRYSPVNDGFITVNNNYETTGIVKIIGEEYGTDEHDFLITPEGTFLLIGIFSEKRDLSSIIPGGSTNADLISSIIQEIDTDNNLIFEWKAADYFDVRDAVDEDLTSNRIDWVHMNSVAIDYDGHILASSRHLSECTKINRQTGEIIWRLGGENNEFDYIDEDTFISYQHAFYPVEGSPGSYTIFDNGNHRELFSRAVEYKISIDGDNKTAEKIWEFRYTPDLFTHRAGNAQRLTNGNTLINFELPQNPKVVEVNPNGEIVYEANLSPEAEVHKSFRFNWEGELEKPYLLSEPLSGGIRLLFNQFGANDINGYKIYGGSNPDNLSFLLETDVTWADIDLRPFAEFEEYFFKVTSFTNAGIESVFSNIAEVQLTNLFSGTSNGILGNSVDVETSDPQWRDSQPEFGSALFFDGINDFVSCGNDNSLQITGSQITLEAWVNPAAFKTDANVGTIIGKDNFIENSKGYTLSCGGNGAVYFAFGNNSIYDITTAAEVLTANQWSHIAAVYDGESLKIYINGILTAENGQVNSTIANASADNLKIGASSYYSNRTFSGIIDEVRIWNVARSQSEIESFMSHQIDAAIYSDAANGLVGYWRFNEASGQTTEDLAIDNNLIINGNFTETNNYWELTTSVDAVAAGSVNDEEKYFLDISNGGFFFDDIQLKQNNIWLVEGNTYTLRFDAWVENAKTINIAIKKSNTPFTHYARIGAVSIQPGIINYESQFEMNESSDNSAVLIISTGGNETDIYFDNFRLTKDITSSIIDNIDFPAAFKLIGNYPNPFNPETTIEYYLHEFSKVKISVYNILGELVQTILDAEQIGGTHKILFSGKNLSSGVYFYSVEAQSELTKNTFYDVRKMILMK